MKEDDEKNFRFPFSLPAISIKDIKFSSREIDILACVVGGRTAKKIASVLSLSPRTVEHYIRNITLKLDCSSRENLIDFIEKSDKVAVIKEHYANLLLYTEFENSLKEISRLNHQSLSCCLVTEEAQESKKSFISMLEKHLKLTGINVFIRASKELEFLPQGASGILDIDYLICINSESFIAKLHREKALRKVALTLKGLLFLSLEENFSEKNTDILKESENITIVNIKGINYYSWFVEILRNLLPPSALGAITERFKEKYAVINGAQKGITSLSSIGEQYTEKKATPVHHKMALLKNLFLKKRGLYGLSAVLIVGVLGLGFLSMRGAREEKGYLPLPNQETSTIRSDLILPKEDLLLNRPELMAAIHDTLKGQDGIRAIALIGTGGAGKTTLARLYTRSQNLPLVWELNAETHEGLINSFEDLAHALSKTEEDKKTLKELQDIKDPEKKGNKILLFVKEKLKALPEWLLIYDNVEAFPDIQSYFPRDEGTWGRGKIILTTRNHNVQNHKYVNSVIFIESLNEQQKIDLFSKIMGNGNVTSMPSTHIEENKEFLKEIPSFPLDVSVAAYYLKATNISYKDYLESLENPEQNFIDMQADILKDSNDYVRTRYSIITLSLQRLLSIDKDFAELLLFISLLDSQNIPRDLLKKHKDKSVVDNFMYNLKKYSLVNSTLESFSPTNVTFSMHRSTQAISLDYLIKKLNLSKDNPLLLSLAHSLENYITNAIEKRNYREVEFLIAHCKAFLNHDLLMSEARAVVNRKLGHIYTYLGNHVKAQYVLEDGLNALRQEEKKNYNEILQTAVSLGNSYRQNGYYEKARFLLEQNLAMYRPLLPEDHASIPRLLCHLGNIYREMGRYEQAKKLLENSLENYEHHHPRELDNAAWVLIHLGTVYRQIGDYKKARPILEKGLISFKTFFPANHLYLIGPLIFLANLYEDLGEYEKAKTLLEQAYHIQQQDHVENHVYAAWVGGHLASVYRKLENSEKAQALLEQSLLLYQKHLPENALYINWVLVNLGDTYKDAGRPKQAKDILEKARIAYEKYYGKNHIETARVISSLGHIALLEGHIEKTEDLFNRAFTIFKQNQHPDIYICLENLSELYQKKSEQAKKAGLAAQAQDFKDQASQNLKQALEIVTTHFPIDSPHARRIQAKIDKLKELH